MRALRTGRQVRGQYDTEPHILTPFKREQGVRKHRRWCAGICGNSLLQAAKAGLQLVWTELSEERKCAQAQPFEHVTACAGGRLGNRAEAGNAPAADVTSR